MATIKFELVSPERRLAEVDAESVTIPGSEGDLTAMAMHAPFLTNLRPGLLVVRTTTDETRYAVTGGFAEVGNETVTVLAEEAVEGGRVTQDWLKRKIEAAEAAHRQAPEEHRPRLLQHYHDTVALSHLFNSL